MTVALVRKYPVRRGVVIAAALLCVVAAVALRQPAEAATTTYSFYTGEVTTDATLTIVAHNLSKQPIDISFEVRELDDSLITGSPDGNVMEDVPPDDVEFKHFGCATTCFYRVAATSKSKAIAFTAKWALDGTAMIVPAGGWIVRASG